MTEVVIRNKNILAKLDYILQSSKKSPVLSYDFFDESKENHQKDWSYTEIPAGARYEGEKYLQPNYLEMHMADTEHEGFPVEYYSTPMENLSSKCDHLKKIREYVKTDFVTELGANSDSLFSFYSPGGFVGWHTNQNNSGHQFLFTWSETGDGYFQYYDKQKQEIVRIDDVPGWQCRHYHFGREEQDHCWHSAYTNCNRITVCVLFRWWDKPDLKDQVLEMKDQLIEEIESEE